MNWFPTMTLRRAVHEALACLDATYHAVEPFQSTRRLPAVDELVLTMLSQSTTDVNSWRGFRALRARFPRWEDAACASLDEIVEAIHPCGLSQQKGPRIQAALQRILLERGTISLDWLACLPPDEALAYLTSFPGVGRKTASCVLLFALDMPAMPVDTHVLRIAERMAWIPPRTSADHAHDMLEALLPEEDYLAFHLNVIAHGRQTCHARRPACERCPVLSCCPFGQAQYGGRLTEQEMPSIK